MLLHHYKSMKAHISQVCTVISKWLRQQFYVKARVSPPFSCGIEAVLSLWHGKLANSYPVLREYTPAKANYDLGNWNNWDIMAIIDRFSKACKPFPQWWKWPRPFSSKSSTIYGLSKDIMLAGELSSPLGSLTLGYQPQSNGQAEHLKQELGSYFWSFCSQEQHVLSKFLLLTNQITAGIWLG